MSIDRRSLIAGASAAAALAAAPAARAEDKLLNLNTVYGRTVIKTRPDIAPKHVAQIETLVKRHFYDGVKFHRVIDGFMAQTGDPTGTGTGKSDLPNIPAEFSKEKFLRGTVRHGARAGQRLGQLPVLHLLRSGALSRGAIYGVGRGDLRHGVHR